MSNRCANNVKVHYEEEMSFRAQSVKELQPPSEEKCDRKWTSEHHTLRIYDGGN